MPKFFVDYDSMDPEYATRYKGSGVTSLEDAKRYNDERIGKTDYEMGIYESHSLFHTSQFESAGKNVIRVERQLAMDLIATDCTVPVEALRSPWSSFYVSFDPSILSGVERKFMPSELRFDGCYVAFTPGNIMFFLVNAEMRKTSLEIQAEMLRPKVFQMLNDLKIEPTIENGSAAMQTIATSCMSDGRFFVLKTHGVQTVSESVNNYKAAMWAKCEKRTETLLCGDDIENVISLAEQPDSQCPESALNALKLLHQSPDSIPKAIRDVANQMVSGKIKSGLDMSRRVHDYLNLGTSAFVAINKIDPEVANLIVNLCVYIEHGDKAEMIPAKTKDASIKTKKALKKEAKAGYSGSYMLVGHNYKSDISTAGSGLNINCWVRGHWRNQAHGEKFSLRKYIYIKPFRKGTGDIEGIRLHRI